jgi:serine/threonine protein kinase
MESREPGLEELLAEAQDLLSAGTFDLEAFCRAHPGHAADLRAHLGLLPAADRALGVRSRSKEERERVRSAIRRLVALDASRGALREKAHYQNLFPGFWDLVGEEHEKARPAEPGPGAAPSAGTTPGTARLPGGPSVPGEPSPRRLATYRLVRELGRGGMGVVYLAEDERLRRRAAVKILSPVFASSEAIRQRFRREATVASRLDHPGICTVYEAGEDDGVPFIAMRFVEGETLEQWIHRSRASSGLSPEEPGSRITRLPPTEGEGAAAAAPAPGRADRGADARPAGAASPAEVHRVLHLVERAARALHAAHEAGLIHRDIKPGNIMVTPRGDPVLLDFGLARDEEGMGLSLTQTGALMGTPAYMSPEQIAAQRIRLDRRTDVYSLGVTLYEALTLRLPFRAATRDSLYQKILATDPENPRALNPNVTPDLRVVLDKTMEKDRERRYATAEEFAEELRRIREDEPILARPPGRVVRVRRWTRRHPGAAGTILVAVLLAAGLPPLASFIAAGAEQALRARMAGNSILREFEDEVERGEKSSFPELQMAASKLRNADLQRRLGSVDDARRSVHEALQVALSRQPEGVPLATAASRILAILEGETAK